MSAHAICPPWCGDDPRGHYAEFAKGDGSWHHSPPVDSWIAVDENASPGYRHDKAMIVRVEQWTDPEEGDRRPVIVLDGHVPGESVVGEFQVDDARRLALALLDACAVVYEDATDAHIRNLLRDVVTATVADTTTEVTP